MADLSELGQRIEQAGLLQWKSFLLGLAKPSIRIDSHVVDEATLPIGASKLGGYPDLPIGTEWPTYKGRLLWHMAQFWMPGCGAL